MLRRTSNFTRIIFFHADFIDLDRIAELRMQSSILRDESSTPLEKNSFIVGPISLLSTPKVVETFPFGSISTSSTFLLLIPYSSFPIARADARFTAVVVLAQPPL